MPLSPALQKALNDQVQLEFASHYAYLAKAAWLAERSLGGAASWMRQQAMEEHAHALKLVDFLIDRGASVSLQAIPAMGGKWKSMLQVFESAQAHEQKVSASIHKLYGMALKAGDYPAQTMLHWFITEQVEEEASSAAIVDRLRMAGDNPAALLMLDAELGSRKGD